MESEITSKKLQDDKQALEVDKNDLNRKLGANEEKIAQLTEQKSKMQQDIESAKSSTLDVNSELSKLNNELREKQNAFESFQNEAETIKLNLERRVDELERQNQLMEQQSIKLKNEMDALQNQKIESENQLNQELQNIKVTSDGEKSELDRELRKLQSSFESDKMQLNREKNELQESLEKSRDELEAKVRDFEMTISNLKVEIDEAKKLSRQNKSSMGSVVDELKRKESEVMHELEGQRHQTDELKIQLDQLQLSKESLKNEYEEKLQIRQNKILKLEGDLNQLQEQQKMSAVGTEEKIKILDDIQTKSYEQAQKITDLTHQLENEVSMKKKLEAAIEESQQKFREMEDEQVDLVMREEQLKIEGESLQRKIQQMNELHAALDDKLKLEKKDSEHFKIVADERIQMMEKKINDINQIVISKDQEKNVIVEKLHLREEEVVQLQAAIKKIELKLKEEAEETQKLLKGKDEELLKIVHECTEKDNRIGDLKTNLENIQSCLNSRNDEKDSSTELVQQLNEAISVRDVTIDELKNKVYLVEKSNKEIEDQLKNIVRAKNQTASECELRISELKEQVLLLEEVKEKEVSELASKVKTIQSQQKAYETTAESSKSNLKLSQNRESDLLLKIKDLELKEAELLLLNQSMNRKVDELETLKGVPRTGDVYDQEMQSHIDFLNSIIADMHKKNLALTHQVEVLGLAPSSAEASGQVSFPIFRLKLLLIFLQISVTAWISTLW